MVGADVEKAYAAQAKERQRLSEGRGVKLSDIAKGVAPVPHLNEKAREQAATPKGGASATY
jgi:hypothetical protein